MSDSIEKNKILNCPECGAKNPASNNFCDSCGYKLNQEKKAVETETKPEIRVETPVQEAGASVYSEPVDGGTVLTATLGKPKIGGIVINWETVIWIVILVFTVITRFAYLDVRALHHDESLHAVYSNYLATGRGYTYDPMMHGPFLFHANALAYKLFGTNDYTARIIPALCGLLLVAAMILYRRYLGKIGALLAGAFIAISPSFMYYSRFLRNDIYLALFSVMIIWGILRCFDTKKLFYLAVAAAGVGLSWATKENHYITLFIFTMLFGCRVIYEYTRRDKPDFKKVDYIGSGFAHLFQKQFLTVFVPAFAVFFVIYTLLYTTFFTNPKGFIGGVVDAIEYWAAQHDVERGGQKIYFYFTMLPVYELLPLLLSIVGSFYYIVQGFIKKKAVDIIDMGLLGLTGVLTILAFIDFPTILMTNAGWDKFATIFYVAPFLPLFLLAAKQVQQLENGLMKFFSIGWWCLAIYIYSLAGEKMPWLIVHPLLPMLFLSALFVQDLAKDIKIKQLKFAVLGLVGIMMVGSISSAVRVSFERDGVNVKETMIYVQSSPDIPRIANVIKNMAKLIKAEQDLGIQGGENFQAVVESYVTWPLYWYLRDFKAISYPGRIGRENLGAPIIISGIEYSVANHDEDVHNLLKDMYVRRRYKQREWWVADMNQFNNAPPSQKMAMLLNYTVFRETWNPNGAYEFWVYIRKDLEKYWIDINGKYQID